MRYLVVDIGNTMSKAALFSGRGEMIAQVRGKSVDYAEFLEGSDITRAIVCAVGVDATSVVQEIERLVDAKVEVLDHSTPLPIGNRYATPLTLGMDRLAAAVGARVLYPNEELMVVDFGTAITIDHLSAEGDFCGGNISAVLLTRLDALHFRAQLLPQISPQHLDELKNNYTKAKVGTTTIEALFYGAVEGIRHEIEGYMRENPNKKTIFSGGDAFFFEKTISFPIFAHNDLTLLGLFEIIRDDV